MQLTGEYFGLAVDSSQFEQGPGIVHEMIAIPNLELAHSCYSEVGKSETANWFRSPGLRFHIIREILAVFLEKKI